MKAIAISKPQKAMIKDKGSNPIINDNKPVAMMLYVKPLRIASSKCPETMLAASLKPKDIALDKYEINSIKTRKGSKPTRTSCRYEERKEFNRFNFSQPW